MCIEWISRILASNAKLAHIHKDMELPLNLSICGVQNKCVNKLYRDAYDKYLTEEQGNKIIQFCQPKSRTCKTKTQNLRVHQAYQAEGQKFGTSGLQT
jgi:hypothetical protein